MQRIYAQSLKAQTAYTLVEQLQQFFVTRLNSLSKTYGEDKSYEAVEWFRDKGTHGGGVRFVAKDETLFNRASVNVSQVQYENDTQKSLNSASAISTIIHPQNGNSPSIHIHISYTELKNGKGYFRVMADLNPSLENKENAIRFTQCLEKSAKIYYKEGKEQGNRYFFIPVLNRHRGVSHFYLENFTTGDFQEDISFAKNIGEKVMQTYIDILNDGFKANVPLTKLEKQTQLKYHTLYLFQVLTLDRGTTSGLLVHNQNDVGIIGSIPKYVDVTMLVKLIKKMPKPQDELLMNIVQAITTKDGEINDEVKVKLAQVVRKHYQKYPNALDLQASANTVPPTVNNHTR